MLGYRSHFTVAGVTDNQPLTAAALIQARSWLRSKHYDADAVEHGQTIKVAEHAEVTLTEVRTQDDALSTMFLLQEHTPRGDWTSRLIVHEPAQERRDPWVWLDIVSPDDAPFTDVPNLMRFLLEVLDGRDGGSRLDPQVRRTPVDEVPDLIEALRDPRRRGLVFVAGSDGTLPMEPWQKLVGDLLRQTTGIATGCVLDAEATQEFNVRVGSYHAVPAGTMRTYVRGVDLNDPLDARRHRYLGTEQIVTRRVASVRRVLGTRAREIALAQPLPTQALRIENLLLAQADRDFFSARKAVSLAGTPRPTPEPPAAVTDPHGTRTEQVERVVIGDVVAPPTTARAETPADAASAIAASVVDADVHLALLDAVSEILGTTVVTADAVRTLRELASETAALRAAVQRKNEQFEREVTTVAELREASAEDRKRLEDEQLEHAETHELLEQSRAEVKTLRHRLSTDGRVEDAWRAPDPDEVDAPAPGSFADLIERMSDLTSIVWTGDDKIAIELDVHNPLGQWASKTWEILLALQDYAAERLAERAPGVEHYLNHTPPHLHGFPANRHATDESTTVKTNAKYSSVRMLRVPEHVDASGRVFMGAHFKIARYGMVTPRMHYLDNVAGDGKVYVGYIGPHLPNGQTN